MPRRPAERRGGAIAAAAAPSLPPAPVRGMTVLELLVAISIFTALGGTLVALLYQTVRAWRTAEARREAFEEAQGILSMVSDDLARVWVTSSALSEARVDGRFLCWFDARGRQRLGFTRTIAGEAWHPVASLGGTRLGGQAMLDGRGDWAEAQRGELRATGGVEEVLYAADPDRPDVLLRAIRAPIGGAESLLDPDALADPERLRAASQPLSRRVLFFGFELWGARTESWQAKATKKSLFAWDSTRGVLDPARDLEDEEAWLAKGTAPDGRDDVVPLRVRITLVVREAPPAGPWSVLLEPLGAKDRIAICEDTSKLEQRLPWVRIGREWVRAKAVDATRLELLLRGGRGTEPASHQAGEDVETGRTFRTVVALPAARADWGEVPDGR